MYTIYRLIDPRDKQVRYIGLTNDVYARFSQHLKCEEENIKKNVWIRELRQANVMLIMETIEVKGTLEEARECEDRWIKEYLSQGCNLFNLQISKAFTYEDFLSAFGKKEDKKETTKRSYPKGDAAQKAKKIMQRYPGIGGTELSRRAKISRSYANRLLANKPEQSA